MLIFVKFFKEILRIVNQIFCFYFYHVAMFEKAELKPDKEQPNQLIIAISSDRGLCGGIHSGISKAIRAKTAEQPNVNTKLVVCGDKARSILQRTHSKHVFFLQNP